MLDALFVYFNTFLNDPYGSLFLILFFSFIVLIIFKKITKFLILIIIVFTIYLTYLFLENKPAPNVPSIIKIPLENNISNFKNWSKELIWKKEKFENID